jgi:ubiquinone/menaquinone biosynthesis C-methylase UbiE
MGQLVFDEEMARAIERMYEIRDARQRRTIVRAALAVEPGDRALDVGCGPGFYCAELLAEVGSSGSVVGIDGSPAMLALAAQRCEGADNVEFHEADATSLPVPDASVDRALCVQVLEYLADPDAALAEMHRTLRPRGRVVVWDIDWATVSIHSNNPARMEQVMRAFDEHLADPSLPRTLAPRLRAAGFADVEMQAYPFASCEMDPETYGAAVQPGISSFVPGRQGITDDEAKAWLAEQRELGERGEYFMSSTQFCFAATKPPA